jgi:hypothetical protein
VARYAGSCGPQPGSLQPGGRSLSRCDPAPAGSGRS